MSNVVSDDFLIERPFGNSSQTLYSEWFDAANLFETTPTAQWSNADFKTKVNHAFATLENHSSRFDQHLFRGDSSGVYETSLKKKNAKTTRAYLLMWRDFTGHSKWSRVVDSPNLSSPKPTETPKLYSPLYFLRRILCSDEYLASDALAHVIVRAEIFAAAIRSFPPPSGTNIFEYIKNAISYENVAASLSKANHYISGRDNYYPNKITDFIVGHLLASRGWVTLAFVHPGTAKTTRDSEQPLMTKRRFIQNRSIDFIKDQVYEFRVSAEVLTLPALSQILTELDGIPIAIPGMSSVLAGGIRTTDAGGVVARINGRSGSGKTSFALAICAALAPMGTETYYLSCEEDRSDLVDRIHSVTPEFLRFTRSYTSPKKEVRDERKKRQPREWFHAQHLASTNAQENIDSTKSFVNEVLAEYDKENLSPGRFRPPGVVPFVVVLDGIHELIGRQPSNASEDQKTIHEIIGELRKLNSLIIVVSAEVESNALRDLDYLVDIVMRLDNRDPKQTISENVRYLHLEKTRRQFSSSGTHRYHISRKSGVRVFPSLSSSLDAFKRYDWHEPNDNLHYDFLSSASNSSSSFLELFDKSQILVTGKGSTGKSQFGLRLLCSRKVGNGSKTPPTSLLEARNELERENRRLLIVSFLYPEKFYKDIVNQITRQDRRSEAIRGPLPNTLIRVITLYPGHVSAEVLVTKVCEELQAGVVQGLPYDGVLIDGLHNIFIQFPLIEDNPMVWPNLVEIFRRIGISTVTTHAHFDLIGAKDDHYFAAEIKQVSNRSGPLLQMLVNGADFYIDVSVNADVQAEDGDEDERSLTSRQLSRKQAERDMPQIRVATAWKQAVPRRNYLLWDRKTMNVLQPIISFKN